MLKGQITPDCVREKLSIARINWLKKNPHPRGMFGKKHSETTKLKMRKQAKFNFDKMSTIRKGRHFSLSTEIKKGMTGNKCPSWKGGRVREQDKILFTEEWKNWRKQVFAKDKYTCQNCGKKSKYLRAHHLCPRDFYPELIFEIDNGLTLCTGCHNRLHHANDFEGDKINVTCLPL